jgi:hypothetical protein
MQSTVGRRAKLAITTTLAVAIPLLAAAPVFANGNNMAKVDIVAEGIDLKPIYVGANANGYTGTEATAHTFLVRVFAKAAGQKRVWKVNIHSTSSDLVMFQKDVGKSEGWDVYGKSHEVKAKPQSLQWAKAPVDVCRDNMKAIIAGGKTKAQVLGNDRKVTAVALIGFSAWADSKASNKKGKHDIIMGQEEHTDFVKYPVQVVCRAAL